MCNLYSTHLVTFALLKSPNEVNFWWSICCSAAAKFELQVLQKEQIYVKNLILKLLNL